MMRYLLFIFCFLVLNLNAQFDEYSFDEEHWELISGEFKEFDGHQCLSGRANLKDVVFTNGIIEYDLYFTGDRTYPAVYFRVQNPGDYEQFYIRPHRIWYDDVLQYAPAHKGASCWQLFHGEGCTSGYDLPYEQWVHIRIDVMDSQARVFIDEAETPALFISHLDHGISSGGIILNSFSPGLSYFTNFKFYQGDIDDMPAPRKKDEPYAMLRDWEVSGVMSFAEIDYEAYPVQEELSWASVKADLSGIVNLSRLYPRTYRTGDAVYARTTIIAENDGVKKYNFGYSDVISVFLNGHPLFTGISTYQSRNLSFLGLIGLNDMLYLPLKEGNNELMILMGEGFGGWGFMFQGPDVLVDERLEKAWETEAVFSVSESVLYDAKREVLYVTNFDQFRRSTTGREQYISKLGMDGEILDLNFIDSLDNPLGMTIHDDKLYIAEKGGYAIVDLGKEMVEYRVPIPECMFPNDIAVDEEGRVFISDSRKNVVWISENNNVSIWLEGKEIQDPNTLKIIDGKLYVGNSGDQRLKAFDLETKDMEVIADFVPGFIDGIRQLPDRSLLVSLWDGKLYHILPGGEINQLLDLKNEGIYIADFEYVHTKSMLFIPTFFKNSVIAYRMSL